MVVSSSWDECSFRKQPPDQASQRPRHDGPSKPLQALTKIVWVRNEIKERPFWYHVAFVFLGSSQDYQLRVCSTVDHKSNNIENDSDDESRIKRVPVTVESRANELCVDVVVEDIGNGGREWNPQGHLGLAVL